MEVDQPEYKLRCELHGHQEDVRAVCVGEIGVITSSRDSTIKVWAEEGPTAYSLVHTLSGHSKYVGAVAYAEPRLIPDMPNGAIVSGSFDASVMVWDVASGTPTTTYKGHQYQVTAVALLPNGDIASASVDSTIRLWRGGKQVGELRGHDGPVLCLAVTEAGDIISGSGDHTLRRWQAKSCVATYKGHTDTVRGVCLLPGVGFVSGSHDCSLRVWSLDGSVLAEMAGHSAIIYAVAAASSGNIIASGSEDNTVRLWSADGTALQVLPHPGCVWAVAFTPGGDLVSGCSDAVGRLWSSSTERQDAEAAAGLTKLLEERSAAAAAAASSAGPMDADGAGGGGGGGGGLPPGVRVAEAFELAQPGAKDGETKLVREPDGAVAAYGWDAAKCVWEKIGTVVDAPEPGSISSGARRWHAGREWDHVFDVEMDSGVKLVLALDAGENPYIVADRFLEQHDLPPSEFKEQIVKFILDNTTGGARAGAAAVADLPITGGFCDPFTGGSSSSSEPRQQRQAPPPAAAFTDITGGGVDPFTGGGSSSRPPAAAVPPQLPARSFLLFDAAPPAAGLRKKLTEFNATLAGQADVAPGSLLTEEEAAEGGLLDQLLACLPAAVAAPAAAGDAPPLSPGCLALLGRLLSWPGPQLFPALDVARCLALHPVAAAELAAGAGSMAAPLLGGLSGALAAAAVSGSGAALQTGLRLAANCFKAGPLRAWALAPGNRELLLDGFAGCAAPGGPGASKGVRLGAATLLLNYAVAAAAAGSGAGGGDGGEQEAAALQLLSGCEELLGQVPGEEADAALRLVLALGSLLAGGGGGGLAGVARDLGLAPHLERLAGGGGGGGQQQQQLVAAVREVQALLK